MKNIWFFYSSAGNGLLRHQHMPRPQSQHLTLKRKGHENICRFLSFPFKSHHVASQDNSSPGLLGFMRITEVMLDHNSEPTNLKNALLCATEIQINHNQYKLSNTPKPF